MANSAQQAAAHGIALIDAPVSGGGGGAAAGTLDGDGRRRGAGCRGGANPVFETFAGLIVHLGGIGAGQKAKLINNAMMAANFSIAHYALTAGETLGVDRKALTELIKVSSGRSYGFEVYARLPAPSAFAHGAMLLAKDVRLLGETLNHDQSDDPSFTAFRELTTPVLGLALKK